MLDLMVICALDINTIHHGFAYRTTEGATIGLFKDSWATLHEHRGFHILTRRTYHDSPMRLLPSIKEGLDLLPTSLTYTSVSEAEEHIFRLYEGSENIRYVSGEALAMEMPYAAFCNRINDIDKFESLLTVTQRKMLRNVPVVVYNSADAPKGVGASVMEHAAMAVVRWNEQYLLFADVSSLDHIPTSSITGAIQHEMIHVDQIFRGDMTILNDGSIKWRGELMRPDALESNSLYELMMTELVKPWEQEAYGRTWPLDAVNYFKEPDLRQKVRGLIQTWQGIDPYTIG